MSKRAILRLDGNLENGFNVNLEVGEEGNIHCVEENAYLPPSQELIQCLEEWRHNYRQLSGSTRITLQKIAVKTGTLSQLATCNQLAKDLRQHFRVWLASGSFYLIDQRIREAVSYNDLLRITLRTQDRRLHLLPWHFWDFIERYPKSEMALNTPMTQLDTVRKVAKARKKVRILAIVGNSTGINTKADRQLLEKSLPNAEVFFLVEPLRQQINEQLWNQHWDILFFAGHSRTEDETGRIYINADDSLTICNLKYGLRQAISRGLQLAIFNSCDGLGLAYELEGLHLPQLIVMRQPVPDVVAQDFLKHLLTAFTEGKRLYLAVREARERLQGLEENFPCASWLPVIFQNAVQPPLTWKDLRYWTVQNNGNQGSFFTNQTAFKWRKLGNALLLVLLASMTMSGLVMGARWQGKLQTAELWAFDFLMQQRPAEKPDNRILVVKATAPDLEKLKENRLSDRTVLTVLEKLKQYNPRAIGLDIYRDIPTGQGYTELVKHLQQEDNIFVICGFPEKHRYSKIGFPPPPGIGIERLGFNDVPVDDDLVIRRHLIEAKNQDPQSRCQTQFSLNFQLALYYLQKDDIKDQSTYDNFLKLGQAVFRKIEARTGGYQNQDFRGYQVLLNYRPYKELEDIAYSIPITDILENRIDNHFIESMQGRVILIGYDDGKEDIHKTPYGKLAGVWIQAHMISQILDAAYGNRSLLWWFPFWGDVLWVWGWSFVGSIFVLRVRSLLLLGITGTVTFFILYETCLSILKSGGWIPIIPTMLALILTGCCIKIYNLLRNQQH
jgi:CHASE2 domain-containing sensor protein